MKLHRNLRYILISGIFLLSACSASVSETETVPAETEKETVTETETEEEEDMEFRIDETVVEVRWEQNASVEALRQMCKDAPVVIDMEMYGGFEQVGALGQRIARNDAQTVTEAGDIVLYSGDQIVVFYGSNSWAYTRLGHITDRTPEEMRQLLGNGNVRITIGKGSE